MSKSSCFFGYKKELDVGGGGINPISGRYTDKRKQPEKEKNKTQIKTQIDRDNAK